MRRTGLLCLALSVAGLWWWFSRSPEPPASIAETPGAVPGAPERRIHSNPRGEPRAYEGALRLATPQQAHPQGVPDDPQIRTQRDVFPAPQESVPLGAKDLAGESPQGITIPDRDPGPPPLVAEMERYRGLRPQTVPPRLPPGQSISERDVRPSTPRNEEVKPLPQAPVTELAQITRAHGTEVIEVGFLLEVEPGAAPPAVILCQEIPEGWELRQADPPADTWDATTRVMKWLRMPEGQETASVTATLVRQDNAPEREWDTTRAWMLYRLPDGRFEEKAPTRHFLEVLP